MAPKLLWIAIIHVLLWNFIFSLSESVELNEDGGLLLNSLRDRVRYTTHICDRLKNSPPVVNHNNNEPLPDSDGDDNAKLAKDLSEQSNPVKRHAILRCYNRPAQENKEPNNPDIITSEWQMKSTPVNETYGDLYDHSIAQKPKVVGLKKIDKNVQKVIDQEPLYHTVPLLTKGNFISQNPKHSLLQLNLQDTANKIKSLISTQQHKLGAKLSDKLVDESLHNKLVQPSLTLSLPPKSITKYPISNPSIRPTEIVNNVDSTGLITDSDKQSNPSTFSPLLPYIPNNNFYQNDLIVKNKPFSSLPSIQFNKPKPVDIFYDRHVPPIVYQPTLPTLVQTPVIKQILSPILVTKKVSISSTNERPQPIIGLTSQYPKIIKIGGSTSQPTPIEKDVAISLPQFINISDTDSIHKPITIEKEVSTSAPKEQKQPIVDLPPQDPQLIQTPDKEPIYQETPGQTVVAENVPYEEKQSTISLSSPYQITESFNSESTSQIMPSGNEVSMPSTYGQQQPIVNFSPPPPPQLQQIKIQKEISIPLPYKPQIFGAPLKQFNTFNTELIPQKKNSLYNQQQPITLPSPPPLTKTTTSAYAK